MLTVMKNMQLAERAPDWKWLARLDLFLSCSNLRWEIKSPGTGGFGTKVNWN